MSRRPQLGAWPWCACAALLLAGAWAAAPWPPAALDWQPGLALAQPWRGWTAAFVHWSPGHRWANSAGALVLGLLGWRARLPLAAALAWLLAWPLTHWGLALRPELLHYGGLSGVLHAGVAIAAWALLTARDRRQRRVGAALLLGLTAKLLLETPWGPVLRSAPGWDIRIAPWAHLSGACAGTLAWALLAARQRLG